MFNIPPTYTPEYIDNLINYLNSTTSLINKQKIITSEVKAPNLKDLTNIDLTSPHNILQRGGLFSLDKARQLVIDYLSNPQCIQSLKPQHKKIIKIYQQLLEFSKANKTLVEGIDEKKLLSLQPAGHAMPAVEEIYDLDDMIKKDVSIPETPEDQVFKGKEKEAEHIPEDSKSSSYVFQPLAQLTPPSNRLLFHIHADEFGSNSQLEGMHQAKEAVNYVSSYIKQTQNNTATCSLFSPDLLHELTHVLEFQGDETQRPLQTEANVKTAQEKISQALEAQTPLLIIGGWKGKPGHAIYYEIIPEPNGTAAFRLYNTGAGLDYHAHVQEGHKIKYHTYTEWKGIDPKKILSAYFLEALYELRTYSTTAEGFIHRDPTKYSYSRGITPTLYDPLDIYSGLKSYLQPKSIASGPEYYLEGHLWMGPQRTGVCAWKSLMAFMRTKMDLKDYKRFKCDIKLQSLQDYVQAHSVDISAIDWRLVLKSHQNLCRNLIKLYRHKLIGDEYLRSAQQSLKPVSEWIQTYSQHRFKPQGQIIDLKYLSPNSETTLINKLHPDKPLHEAVKSAQDTPAVIRQPWRNLLPQFAQISFDDPTTVEQSLDKTLKLSSEAWLKGEDNALHQGLIHNVTAMNLDEKYWNTAVNGDKAKAQKLITLLGEVSSLFLSSCFTQADAHLKTPEKLYVASKILFLQQHLFSLANINPEWKHMRFIKLFDEPKWQTRDLFSISNAKIQADLKILRGSKFAKINDDHLIFKSSDSGEYEVRSFSKYDIFLADMLYKECVETINKLSQQDPSFSEKDAIEQKALVYASDHLPDWAKAMRNAQVAHIYLQDAPISSLININRQTVIDPQFKVVTYVIMKTQYNVNISLNGILNDKLEKTSEEYVEWGKDLRLKPGQYPKLNTNAIKNFCKFHINAFSNHILATQDLDYEKPFIEKNIHAKDHLIDMLDEEFQEFFHIFLENHRLSQVEILEYFIKHPEKLDDPDYQALLEVILFKPYFLSENLAIKGFSEHLTQFIQKNYDIFIANNKIQGAAFLLKLAGQLRGFCPDVPLYDNTVNKLQLLLTKKGLEPLEKGFIYAILLSQLSQKQTLTEEETADLISGSIFLAENKSLNLDPVLLKQAKEAVTVQASRMKEYLERGKPNQTLLNMIIKALRPNQSAELQWKMDTIPGEYPSFYTSDEHYQLYPLLSTLVSDGNGIVAFNVLTHPLFKTLFPSVQYVRYLPGNVMTFKDPKDNQETLVSLNDNKLVVEKKLRYAGQEGWYRYVSPDTFFAAGKDKTPVNLLGNSYIVHQFTHWESLAIHPEKSMDILAIDKNTGQIGYCLKGTQVKLRYETLPPDSSSFKIHEIIHVGDGLKISQPSAWLRDLEDPAYILEEYDDTPALKKIELPRFNLSFTPDPNHPQKWLCFQVPNFYLKQPLETVRSLGRFPHYLCLVNDKGDRKVIIPWQPFKAPEQKEVLLPQFEVDRQLTEWPAPQKYLIFDVQKNGRLSHKSREANLYLAQVLGISQEYAQAIEHLKKIGKKTSAHLPAEEQLLRDISKISEITGDQSGNVHTLQIFADYLRIKNAIILHRPLDEQDLSSLRSHYNLYLNHYRHATASKLTSHEELFILKLLLTKQFDPSHYMRLKELHPYAASLLPVPTAASSSESSSNPMELPQNNKFYLLQKDAPEHHILLTRPQAIVNKHFGYYYKTAKEGPQEDKDNLRHKLIFLRQVEDGKYSKTADLLESVLDNPSAFPDYNPWDFDLDKKIKEALTIVPPKQAEVPQTLPGKDMGNITPEGFRLDEPQPAIPLLEFPFSLRSLPSLSADCKSAKCFQNIPAPDNSPYIQSVRDVLSGYDTSPQLDPVQKKEILRLRDDLDLFKAQTGEKNYTFNPGGLEIVKELLAKDRMKDQGQLQKLEQRIVELANKKPSSPEALAKFQIESWGELRKVITVEELLIYFARNDYTPLLQRNPNLDIRDIRRLAKLAGRYLLHATRDQQRHRAEALMEKLETLDLEAKGKTPEYAQMVNQLAQEMLAERQFNPQDRPAYLIFEYFADISIRPAQRKKLEKLLKHKDLNLVMEMIMGSGKSKVLLPLLGLMRADGKDLSMLIVPQALFESISQDTQASLQGAFSQTLRAVNFDRNMPFTQEYLEGILDDLEHIRKNKECLIMTHKSVQCLILKFIGECAQHFEGPNKDKEFSPELKALEKILGILRNSGYPIIDEADTVLNVLHEVNFSGGKQLSPPFHEIELLSELYSLIYEDPALQKLARIESNPQSDKKAAVLTETLYFEKMQRPLAEAFIQRLGSMTFESRSTNEKMHNYISSLNEAHRSLLLYYLCRNKEHLEESQRYYDSLDEDIQDIIALAGEQISHLLPYTLTRICDEKYGLDANSGSPLAIPFSATNTPSSGSQFANPHITMNYTFQMYMKNGISKEVLERQIKILQEKALREIAESDGKMTANDTEAGKVFALLKGHVDMPLFNHKPVHLYELLQHINTSPSAKRAFVSHLIMPQLQLFEEKISCNPHNLASLFPHLSGFTGTLWNGMSMHHTLNPQPEMGTDAKTLALLCEHSRHNTLPIKEGSTQELLKQLKDLSIDFDLISDAGGYFKEGGNKQIAHAMADTFGKPTAYYNNKGEQTLSGPEKDIPLDPSDKKEAERLTFLDQIHTTGADVPQKWNAVGLVTIGRNILLRDLLQSVWRLRGLSKAQRVRFMVTDEVAGIIRQQLKLKADHPIDFDAILKFAIDNQASQQGVDNYKALKQEFANIPQFILLKALMHKELSPEHRAEIFQVLKSQWIKPAVFRTHELYGKLAKEQPSAQILEADKKQCTGTLQEIFSKLPWLETLGISSKDCLHEIDAFVDWMKDSLPTFLTTSLNDYNQTVEVERVAELETHTRQETNIQLQAQTAAMAKTGNLAWMRANRSELIVYKTFEEALPALQTEVGKKARFSKEIPVFPLASYLESDPLLKPYFDAFEGIDITLNVLQWSPDNTEIALLGGYRTPFHHLLVKDDQVTLLTHLEAKEHFKDPNYYNLALGFHDPHKKLTPDQFKKIVKLKFLNGESQFTKEEIGILKSWFQSQGIEKMQKLYLEHIIKGYPLRISRYQNSTLQKLFAA